MHSKLFHLLHMRYILSCKYLCCVYCLQAVKTEYSLDWTVLFESFFSEQSHHNGDTEHKNTYHLYTINLPSAVMLGGAYNWGGDMASAKREVKRSL